MIRFNVIELTKDRRTPEQISRDAALVQQAADIRLEQEWRERVAENVRQRLARRVG